MKMSPFFSDLSSTYAFEIEDLTYDSAGDNVLKARLKVKRDQFGELLAMIDSFPVMVVPAFRGAFRFGPREIFGRLIASQPDDFPSWQAVSRDLELQPWAASLAQRALDTPEGEQFMLIATGLEYIFDGPGLPATPSAEETEGAVREPREDAAGDDDEPGEDLAEAGEDYLSEQGFDRRN